MKKDRLYTVNRWNRPAFMPENNIFEGGGPMMFNPYDMQSNIKAANNLKITAPQVSLFDTQASDITSQILGNENYNQESFGVTPVSYNVFDPESSTLSTPKITLSGANKIIAQNLKIDAPVIDDNYLQNFSLTNPSSGNLFGTQDAIERSKQISAKKAFANKINYKQLGQQVGGAILATPEGQKMLDTFDPVYHIAGGRESTVGNGLSSAGKSVFTAGVSTGNPWLMAGGAGLKIAGGLTNAAFGSKMNKENIADVEKNISGMRESANVIASSSDTGSLLSNAGKLNMGYDFGNGYIGKDGWFSSKAKKKAESLRNQQNVARGYAAHALNTGAQGTDSNTDRRAKSVSAAFGGPLNIIGNDNMGAIGYGLMSDYMNMKNTQAQGKNNTVSYLGALPSTPLTYGNGGGIHIKKSHEGLFTEQADRAGMGVQEYAAHVLANKDRYPSSTVRRANFARNASHWHSDGGLLGNSDTLFALGGDLQTNGSDWSDGLTLVNAGGSHESNPNQGVQMGLAPDNTPNLVEEGETIFNDYVFSNRIHPTKDVLEQFHMYSKGGKLTYADVSKRLEKEAKERPNDPISAAALKKMLEKLAEAQENQKAEEEVKKAREAFEALTPEEQQQVIAQITAQQQADEQQTQEGEEVPVDENGNPAGQQEQPVEEGPVVEQPAGESGAVGACGGMLNHKYLTGGELMKAVAGYLNFSTEKQLSDWLSKNNIKDFDWEKAAKTGDLSTLQDAVAKDSPRFAYALKKGFNFNPAVTGTVYNMDNFIHDTLSPYSISKNSKYSKGLYDYSTDDYKKYIGDYKTVGDYEKGDSNYKDFTNNVLNFINSNPQIDGKGNLTGDFNTPENRQYLKYFRALQKGLPNSSNVYKMIGTGAGNLFNRVGDFDAATLWSKARGDGDWGLLHFTPTANTPTSDVTNIFDDNGNLTELYDTNGYTDAKTPYVWRDADGNQHTLNFYTKGATPADDKSKGNDSRLPYRDERWRYAGIFGPAIGLGLWGAGVGKPDNSGLDAALSYADAPGDAYASYTPFGQYRTYTPFGIWSTQIAADKSKNGTDLAIRNNGAPVGTTNAALVANDMAAQEGTAKTMRQAKEYNDSLAQQVFNNNNALAEANAKLANSTSIANAEIANKNRQYRASLAEDIAAKKQAADAQWYNALYGNTGQVTNAIAGIGNDNMAWNQVAGLYNVGALGKYDPRDVYGMTGRNPRGVAARGGKLRRKKKRGLTY